MFGHPTLSYSMALPCGTHRHEGGRTFYCINGNHRAHIFPGNQPVRIIVNPSVYVCTSDVIMYQKLGILLYKVLTDSKTFIYLLFRQILFVCSSGAASRLRKDMLSRIYAAHITHTHSIHSLWLSVVKYLFDPSFNVDFQYLLEDR